MLDLPLSAVVCAAGAGSRMGFNKALCRLNHASFLSNIVESLISLQIHSIFVVVGSQADVVMAQHTHLPVQWIVNPQWSTTFMLDSLLCGLAHVPAQHAVLHWPVDCVDIDPRDLKKLIDLTDADLAALAFEGQLGHPMKISARAVAMLKQNASHYASLRDFVKDVGIRPVHAQFGALMNCNTPEQLQTYIALHVSHETL